MPKDKVSAGTMDVCGGSNNANAGLYYNYMRNSYPQTAHVDG